MSLAARKAAAEKYRPRDIGLLLVAEAPPCDLDRYFYFEGVDRHDWLFRYVWEGLTGEKPSRAAKAAHLASLRDMGLFMIDLHEDNISQPSVMDLYPRVPDLVERCKALSPRAIVLVKSMVYDTSFGALHRAGLPVIPERIPFPSSGQQKKFLEGFRNAIHAAGFRPNNASAS